jgi:hypothetical protein
MMGRVVYVWMDGWIYMVDEDSRREDCKTLLLVSKKEVKLESNYQPLNSQVSSLSL